MNGADPCPCGTRRPPEPWRKYSKAHGIHLRCPACKLMATVASHRGVNLVENWNDTVREARAKRQGTVAAWPPIAGTYATTFVKDGPRVPVRIWFGPPIIDGEQQDRAPRWNVEVDGRTDRWEADDDSDYRCRVTLDVDRYWPYVARDPIPDHEYRFLISHAAWAREHQPEHPKARPHEAVDFNTLPMRF